jgi:hypothetical protein
LETTPPDATHWSTRALAAKHGISNERVAAIWRAFGLKPWLPDEFKISPDPQLAEKIRDIVALHMNPPVAAAVFAVDEKPQIQAPEPHRPDPADAPDDPHPGHPRLLGLLRPRRRRAPHRASPHPQRDLRSRRMSPAEPTVPEQPSEPASW